MNRSREESDVDCVQDKKVDEEIEAKRVQETIKYILAKQMKSTRTGQQLGFPAFNCKNIIVGFYRESTFHVGVSRFILLSNHKDDFGPFEVS